MYLSFLFEYLHQNILLTCSCSESFSSIILSLVKNANTHLKKNYVSVFSHRRCSEIILSNFRKLQSPSKKLFFSIITFSLFGFLSKYKKCTLLYRLSHIQKISESIIFINVFDITNRIFSGIDSFCWIFCNAKFWILVQLCFSGPIILQLYVLELNVFKSTTPIN